MNGKKVNARTRIEKNVDIVLKNMKLKILGQPHEEVLTTTDTRYKYNKANEDRTHLKDGLESRIHFRETGSVKNYLILISKQLDNEVLYSFHGVFGKQPGINKLIIAYRERYYLPKTAQLMRKWVMSCEQCITASQNDRSFSRSTLHNPIEHLTALENAMQFDLLPEITPSGGYEKIVTAMDVFSRYLIAYRTSNQGAKTIAKVINNIMTKHAYSPTTHISDKGSVARVNKEVVSLLGNYSKARHHKARSNNRATWAISRVNQTSIEAWDRPTMIVVA